MLQSVSPLPPRAADRYAGPCAVQEALCAIGGKWAPAVVGRLARGGARFQKLREALGETVSAKVLTAELRRLEAAGVVVRDASGPGVAYRLTAHGRALVPLLDALGAWAASVSSASGQPSADSGHAPRVPRRSAA